MILSDKEGFTEGIAMVCLYSDTERDSLCLRCLAELQIFSTDLCIYYIVTSNAA